MLFPVWMVPGNPPEILFPFQNDGQRHQSRVQGGIETPTLAINALIFASRVILFELKDVM